MEFSNEKKKEEISRGSGDMRPPPPPHYSSPPPQILKVETNICAILGILEADLKKSSTLKFMMNISFVLSICLHQWVLKKVCTESIFSPQFSIFIPVRTLVSLTLGPRQCSIDTILFYIVKLKHLEATMLS